MPEAHFKLRFIIGLPSVNVFEKSLHRLAAGCKVLLRVAGIQGGGGESLGGL
jgi:hypothetical protein